MLVLLQVKQKITLLVQAGSDDSKDVTSASVSYAVASGVTAILGYTSVEASDEGVQLTMDLHGTSVLTCHFN